MQLTELPQYFGQQRVLIIKTLFLILGTGHNT
jgi:hypothetical protein